MPVAPQIRTHGRPWLELQVDRGSRAERFALNVPGRSVASTSEAALYPCIQPGTWTSELTSDGYINEAFQVLFTGYDYYARARTMAEIIHTARESAYSTRNRVRLLWNETDEDGESTALLTCVVVDARMAALDYSEVVNRTGANSKNARVYAVSITHTPWEYNIDSVSPDEIPGVAFYTNKQMGKMQANPIVPYTIQSREARIKSMFIKPLDAKGHFRRLWLGWRRFIADADTDTDTETATNFRPEISMQSRVWWDSSVVKTRFDGVVANTTNYTFFTATDPVYHINFYRNGVDYSGWRPRVIFSMTGGYTFWNPNMTWNFASSYIGKYRLLAWLTVPNNDDGEALYGVRPRLIWYGNRDIGNIIDLGEQIVGIKYGFGKWIDFGEFEIGDWGFDVDSRMLPSGIALAFDAAVLGVDKGDTATLTERKLVLGSVALVPAENLLYIEAPFLISSGNNYGLEIIQDVYGNVRAYHVDNTPAYSKWQDAQMPQYVYGPHEARPRMHFEATVQASDGFMLPINSGGYGNAQFTFMADRGNDYEVSGDSGGTTGADAKYEIRLGVVPRYMGDIGHA